MPTVAGEAEVLARCLVHAVRRRCGVMLVLAAHRAGRLSEAIAPAAPEPAEDFLSGTSGHVAGRRAALRRLADRSLDVLEATSGRRGRLDRQAASQPPRAVLVVIVRRTGVTNTAETSARELERSRHRVRTAIVEAGVGGKFENVNRALAAHPDPGRDWLLVVDDDVVLPDGFLDRFLLLTERHRLRIAQPAQTLASHAAWPITRRRPGSALRETSYVEIGPVTAFHRETFPALLPFPSLRAAWGLDHHWAAIAREHGWPIGIVDATAVRHELRPVATHYGRSEAIAEGRDYLAGRPHVTRAEVRTLVTHRDWR